MKLTEFYPTKSISSVMMFGGLLKSKQNIIKIYGFIGDGKTENLKTLLCSSTSPASLLVPGQVQFLD